MLLLGTLLNDSPADIEPFAIFTIRSDGAARLFQMIADQEIEVPESLPLLPLPPSGCTPGLRGFPSPVGMLP
jgi:hypothetical protein